MRLHGSCSCDQGPLSSSSCPIWMQATVLGSRPAAMTQSPSQLPEAVLILAMQGYAFAGLSAVLSAVAAVYTEWVMKHNNDSLYWQNMQLYSYGMACNALGLTINDLRTGAARSGSLSNAPMGEPPVSLWQPSAALAHGSVAKLRSGL